MKYMMMIFAEDAVLEITRETLVEWGEFGREASNHGKLLAGAALQPPATANVVSVRNGETLVTDGPFADTKEHLAGFTVFDCEDLEVAIKVASMVPWAGTNGHVEIRPIVDFGGRAA